MTKVLVNSQGKAYLTGSGKAIQSPEIIQPVINSLSVTPSTSAQTINATTGVDGYAPVNVSAVTSSIDSNITANNIKNGVTILGVTGSYEGGSKYGCSINNILGDVDANGVLQDSNISTNLVFSNVVDINNSVLEYRFSSNQNIQSVSFPDLTTLSHSSSLSHAFDGCKSITTASFPSLTTISGHSVLQYAFYNCSSLTSISFSALVAIENSSTGTNNNACQYMISGSGVTSISFPSLVRMTGASPALSLCRGCSSLVEARFPVLTELSNSSNSFGSGFRSCTALTDIYFNSLTTTSFGSNNKNPFSSMMTSTGNKVTHTIHFPSNLESTISGLTGYPLFGGTSGYVVCAFDLPATS